MIDTGCYLKIQRAYLLGRSLPIQRDRVPCRLWRGHQLKKVVLVQLCEEHDRAKQQSKA